ncbi:MAG: hypothetical protein OQK12_11120 [Motiliproteus sp.]|nr:hypothetical protein [Motiliproteus sp.]MCW9052106.1 hypothetical protein [Motiliproteus sp.]
MTLLALIRQLYARSRAVYVERALYHKLSAMEPHLLQDVGLKLENGKVVSTRPANSCKLHKGVVGRRTESAEKRYQSHLKGAGG